MGRQLEGCIGVGATHSTSPFVARFSFFSSRVTCPLDVVSVVGVVAVATVVLLLLLLLFCLSSWLLLWLWVFFLLLLLPFLFFLLLLLFLTSFPLEWNAVVAPTVRYLFFDHDAPRPLHVFVKGQQVWDRREWAAKTGGGYPWAPEAAASSS